MNKSLENLVKAIEGLGAAIVAGKPDSSTYLATWGWNCPALNSQQIADQMLRYSAIMKSGEAENLSKEDEINIAQCLAAIQAFQGTTLQYMFNGNAAAAYPTYIALVESVRSVAESVFGWNLVPKANSIPANISRRIEKLNAAVDNCIVNEKELSAKIALIDEAHETAGELPLTLKQLNDAKESVERSSQKSSEYVGKLDTVLKAAENHLEKIGGSAEEAQSLARQCSEAYRATTSIGLGAAFDARALSLAKSLKWWVAGLFAALCAGALVGYVRFEKLSEAMTTSKIEPIVVLVEMTVSVLSLGLPLWFAWIATKQIQERFKLSEDYAFKASVAKAYEGFRREAVRFNPEIEERLFAAALSRLEEEPLRYVDLTTHASPYHESGVISAASSAALEFKDMAFKTVKKKLGGGEE